VQAFEFLINYWRNCFFKSNLEFRNRKIIKWSLLNTPVEQLRSATNINNKPNFQCANVSNMFLHFWAFKWYDSYHMIHIIWFISYEYPDIAYEPSDGIWNLFIRKVYKLITVVLYMKIIFQVGKWNNGFLLF